jgi:regulator of protease activity HflC (stomatin/prohibitin superfamily)
VVVVLCCVGLLAFCLWGIPQYRVYEQRLSGQAKLAEAEYSRQVLTKEAEAKEESAKHLAKAEIERAKGVAQANTIIGDSLNGNEAYLWYLWIHNLEVGNHEVIYVPTEAQLPILEANRLHKPITKGQAKGQE